MLLYLSLASGGLVEGLSGQISSPTYPQPYEHFSSFVWVIRVPDHMFVRVTFQEVDIEDWMGDCYYDWLAVMIEEIP